MTSNKAVFTVILRLELKHVEAIAKLLNKYNIISIVDNCWDLFGTALNIDRSRYRHSYLWQSKSSICSYRFNYYDCQ